MSATCCKPLEACFQLRLLELADWFLLGWHCLFLLHSPERESLGPTGMGDGIAIPHARVSKVDSVKGIFVRLEKPILFDSVDGIPVDLVFALFAPLGTNGDHLKALARVSRLLRSKNTRHKLRSNQDSSVIYSILTEENEEKAA